MYCLRSILKKLIFWYSWREFSSLVSTIYSEIRFKLVLLLHILSQYKFIIFLFLLLISLYRREANKEARNIILILRRWHLKWHTFITYEDESNKIFFDLFHIQCFFNNEQHINQALCIDLFRDEKRKHNQRLKSKH